MREEEANIIGLIACTLFHLQIYDPNFMGFRSLRVINEDVVAPANALVNNLTKIWKLFPMLFQVN